MHNSNIQLCIKDSINNITTCKNIPKFNSDKLIQLIINDDVLICKEHVQVYLDHGE